MTSKANEIQLERMRSTSTAMTSGQATSGGESSDDSENDDPKSPSESQQLITATEEKKEAGNIDVDDDADEPDLDRINTTVKVIINEDISLSKKYMKYLTIDNDDIVSKEDKIDALILLLKLPHIYALPDDEQFGVIQDKYTWIDDDDEDQENEIDQFQYEEIQEVVHHMISIERRYMYDTIEKYNEKDDEIRNKYRLFPGKVKTLRRFQKIKNRFQNQNVHHQSKYVCSGCGVVLIKKKKDKGQFNIASTATAITGGKKKKFSKYSKGWRGYVCRESGREFIFHNRLCVKFRKAKEWIRDAIYDEDAKKYTQPSRMQIDYLKNEGLDEGFQPTQFYTTFDETEKKRVKYTKNIRYYYRECVNTDLRGYDIDEGDRFSFIPKEIKYLDQREFAMPMFKYLIHAVQVKEFTKFWVFLRFAASYINTPQLILLLKDYAHVLFPLHDDTHSGGDSAKNDLIEFLTIIAEGSLYPIATCLYIAAFIKENGDLYWNDEETEVLSKHFRNMANTIIDEIESEHLVAIILETPTNIFEGDDDTAGLSVIDIAIKYKMLRFLQNNKISRIATTLWYDRKIIHPSIRFGDELSFFDLFQRLRKTPAEFYFSPSGLNIIRVGLYMMYLILFSWVTWARRYNYSQSGAAKSSQNLLWVFNVAAILYEFYRCFTQIGRYFTTIANINEFVKAILWIILFFLRFVYGGESVKQECLYVVQSADPFYIDCSISGNTMNNNANDDNETHTVECQKLVFREDPYDCWQEATHNQYIVEAYMMLWAIQCVLFWMTLLFYLQRTRTVGPMLKMISLMLRDMLNFLFLMVVFWVSVSMCIFYILGDEMATTNAEAGSLHSSMTSALFYGMLTMLGQQDWESVEDVSQYDISDTRAMLLDILVAFAALIGTMLLLNLLIAMLSDTYKVVSERTVLEVNYTRITQSYAASREITLIPPPLNYFAFGLMSLLFLVDLLLTACTARTKMLNDWAFTPLNRDVFSAGDMIDYKDNDKKDKQSGYVQHCFTCEVAQIQVADKIKFIHKSNILKIKKDLLTERLSDADSNGVCASIASSGRYYCKYCRYFFHGDQVGNVQQINHLFKYYHIMLDDDDVGKIGNMLNEDVTGDNKNLSLRQLGVAQLCPQCYRPFYCSEDHSDEVQRLQYLSEVASFWVFMLVCYIPLIVAFCVPAAISYIFQVLVGKEQLIGGAKAKREKQQEKLAKKLKMSQNNNRYRRFVVACFDDIRPLHDYVETITKRLNHVHKKIRESEIDDEEDNVVTQLHQEMLLKKLVLTPKEGRIRMQKLRKWHREWMNTLNQFIERIKKGNEIKKKKEEEQARLYADDNVFFD